MSETKPVAAYLTYDRTIYDWLTLPAGKGGFLVRINLRTGEINYGPNYTPDEAAKTFWSAVGQHAPRVTP